MTPGSIEYMEYSFSLQPRHRHCPGSGHNWEASSVVAFSLGGSVFTAFAPHFSLPYQFEKRLSDEHEATNYRFPFLLPSLYRMKLVGKIVGLHFSPNGRSKHRDQSKRGHEMDQEPQVMMKEGLDIPRIAQWHFNNHDGYIHSCMTTLGYGPIMRQHSDWSKVCSVIKGDPA